ncbi:ATP-binding component of a transport system [gamma proteobacterium HdN1]|nr:ATP-binding component of a transport system [gamma proteobacterium HdN1]
MAIFSKLSWYFRSQWRRYGAAILMLAVVACLSMVPAWVVGKFVDSVVDKTLNQALLLRYVLTIVSVVLVVYVLRFLWRALLYGASYQLGAILRQRLYQKFVSMDPWFHQRYGTGDLMARATNDVAAVEMAAGEGVLTLVDGLITGAVVLGVLFWFNWKLALIVLIPWPAMSWVMWLLGEQLHAAFGNAQRHFSRLNDQVHYGLTGVRVVRALGLETHEGKRFTEVVRATTAANAVVAAIDAKYEPTIYFTIGLSFLLCVAGGSWFVHEGSMTLGKMTTFTMYMGHLIWPMFAYGWMLNIVERGSAAHRRLEDIFDASPAQFPGQQEQLDTQQPLTVAIERFCFPDEERAALTNVHFTLPAASTLGVVGRTGSGKSTLVSLVAGLYPLHEGEIRWGDTPIQTLSDQTRSQKIAVVPQDPFLFSATIEDNIRLGKPHATFEEVEKAARAACIHDDILRLADGYQTQVGERGMTLSGGQKQRISIARALLIDADFLLLDDALSAVDARTEAKILAGFKQLRKDRTTLIVSHRMSAVEHASQILVLEGGSIVAQGAHPALMSQQGWYAQMVRYQQWEAALDDGSAIEGGSVIEGGSDE